MGFILKEEKFTRDCVEEEEEEEEEEAAWCWTAGRS